MADYINIKEVATTELAVDWIRLNFTNLKKINNIGNIDLNDPEESFTCAGLRTFWGSFMTVHIDQGIQDVVNFAIGMAREADGITESATRLWFTPEERDKLELIEEDANNYIHLGYHNAYMITDTVSPSRIWFTEDERNYLGVTPEGANNYIHPNDHPIEIITDLLGADNKLIADPRPIYHSTVRHGNLTPSNISYTPAVWNMDSVNGLDTSRYVGTGEINSEIIQFRDGFSEDRNDGIVIIGDNIINTLDLYRIHSKSLSTRGFICPGALIPSDGYIFKNDAIIKNNYLYNDDATYVDNDDISINTLSKNYPVLGITADESWQTPIGYKITAPEIEDWDSPPATINNTRVLKYPNNREYSYVNYFKFNENKTRIRTIRVGLFSGMWYFEDEKTDELLQTISVVPGHSRCDIIWQDFDGSVMDVVFFISFSTIVGATTDAIKIYYRRYNDDSFISDPTLVISPTAIDRKVVAFTVSKSINNSLGSDWDSFVLTYVHYKNGAFGYADNRIYDLYVAKKSFKPNGEAVLTYLQNISTQTTSGLYPYHNIYTDDSIFNHLNVLITSNASPSIDLYNILIFITDVTGSRMRFYKRGLGDALFSLYQTIEDFGFRGWRIYSIDFLKAENYAYPSIDVIFYGAYDNNEGLYNVTVLQNIEFRTTSVVLNTLNLGSEFSSTKMYNNLPGSGKIILCKKSRTLMLIKSGVMIYKLPKRSATELGTPLIIYRSGAGEDRICQNATFFEDSLYPDDKTYVSIALQRTENSTHTETMRAVLDLSTIRWRMNTEMGFGMFEYTPLYTPAVPKTHKYVVPHPMGNRPCFIFSYSYRVTENNSPYHCVCIHDGKQFKFDGISSGGVPPASSLFTASQTIDSVYTPGLSVTSTEHTADSLVFEPAFLPSNYYIQSHLGYTTYYFGWFGYNYTVTTNQTLTKSCNGIKGKTLFTYVNPGEIINLGFYPAIVMYRYYNAPDYLKITGGTNSAVTINKNNTASHSSATNLMFMAFFAANITDTPVADVVSEATLEDPFLGVISRMFDINGEKDTFILRSSNLEIPMPSAAVIGTNTSMVVQSDVNNVISYVSDYENTESIFYNTTSVPLARLDISSGKIERIIEHASGESYSEVQAFIGSPTGTDVIFDNKFFTTNIFVDVYVSPDNITWYNNSGTYTTANYIALESISFDHAYITISEISSTMVSAAGSTYGQTITLNYVKIIVSKMY